MAGWCERWWWWVRVRQWQGDDVVWCFRGEWEGREQRQERVRGRHRMDRGSGDMGGEAVTMRL